MTQTIINIGNSAGIIIPKEILKSSGIKPGDKVKITEEKDRKISISPVKDVTGGVNVSFIKMVDDFMEEHKDVLQALSNR
ncbi:MAG: AbrB/MazE/SpoVT family DNA-binding domain-containing protein [Candidatus Levybacteria bacterium]|nr:AbrB/MazE/SpoVT family DNA-binding domain-containing protein [Candidatus Levybacteria bacterium]